MSKKIDSMIKERGLIDNDLHEFGEDVVQECISVLRGMITDTKIDADPRTVQQCMAALTKQFDLTPAQHQRWLQRRNVPCV